MCVCTPILALQSVTFVMKSGCGNDFLLRAGATIDADKWKRFVIFVFFYSSLLEHKF